MTIDTIAFTQRNKDELHQRIPSTNRDDNVSLVKGEKASKLAGGYSRFDLTLLTLNVDVTFKAANGVNRCWSALVMVILWRQQVDLQGAIYKSRSL